MTGEQTAIQWTSRAAYQTLAKDLNARQTEVYAVILNHPGLCNLEIAQKANLPINQVTPRVLELRTQGRVVSAGYHKCPLTGRKALLWKAS